MRGAKNNATKFPPEATSLREGSVYTPGVWLLSSYFIEIIFAMRVQLFLTIANTTEDLIVYYYCPDIYQVETDRISKYVLEIKDVLEFKDART